MSKFHSVPVPRPPRLLIVDDDRMLLDGLMRLLKRLEPTWEIGCARGGEQALERLAECSFDVVLTDLHMPGLDGFGLLERLERSHPGTLRVVHSSRPETLALNLAAHLAHRVVEKPARSGELVAALRAVMAAARGQHLPLAQIA
ncbi:MAG TPA: response regulator [Polyangiaceae bacterium]